MSDFAPPTAIVAHGKNWEVPVPADPTEIQLSLDSRLTAMAAGILYMDGVAEKIVFSSGKTAGDAYPAESTAQFAELRRYFTSEQIPDDDVLSEDESFDTAGNVINIKQWVDEGRIGAVYGLTVGYHVPRLRRLAARHGLSLLGAFASDKIVGQSELAVPDLRGKPHYYGRLVLREAQEKRSVRPLVRVASQFALEAAAHTLMTVDPHGTGVSRLITTRLRHRTSD
jgi:uncharacterized SAM-binding protein YcdF (DUF218 family)